MARRYTFRTDGEWFFISKRSQRLACCDCGLVHDVRVKVRSGRVFLSAVRDDQETTSMRRRFRRQLTHTSTRTRR